MATSKRIVTITGATGFVGRHFVERLVSEKKYRIRCLVRHTSDVSPCCGYWTRTSASITATLLENRAYRQPLTAPGVW